MFDESSKRRVASLHHASTGMRAINPSDVDAKSDMDEKQTKTSNLTLPTIGLRAFAARGRHRLLWFLGLQIFIIVVSVHDAGLLVLNQELILEYERNPIGAWLIAVNAGSVWLFVYLKLIGTGLVSAILAGLYEQLQSTACTIVSVLALIQGTLLVYLYAT